MTMPIGVPDPLVQARAPGRLRPTTRARAVRGDCARADGTGGDGRRFRRIATDAAESVLRPGPDPGKAAAGHACRRWNAMARPASSRCATRRVASARRRPRSTSAPRWPSSAAGCCSSTSTRRARCRWVSGSHPHNLDLTTYDLLMRRDVSFDDIVLKTSVAGLDLLPSNIDLSAAEVQLVNEVAREQTLLRALQPGPRRATTSSSSTASRRWVCSRSTP